MSGQADVYFKEDDFTSATEGQKLKTHLCLAVVSGTFSGTLQIKWEDEGGTVHTVQEDGSDLDVTAPIEKVLDFGVPVIVYWECTGYTSGTAKASLTGTSRR